MSLEELQGILRQISESPHVLDKARIAATHDRVGLRAKLPQAYQEDCEVLLGDDCTAIPDGTGGHMLFAAEGIISDFLESDPWFAGYCAVMVNVSDVLAMGGLPTAVTDVIWGKDKAALEEIWQGMVEAATAYDVPIVGGHTCYRAPTKALAVSILGRAKALLSSFSAKPGQHLLMAVDMKGAYYGNYPFWNASTDTPHESLRENLGLMYDIANRGLSHTAKDISMGGLLGTMVMLGNTSKVGFDVNFDQLIPPPDGDWLRWLLAFPSFGFILCCDDPFQEDIKALFARHEIHCHTIGKVKEAQGVDVWQNEVPIKFI